MDMLTQLDDPTKLSNWAQDLVENVINSSDDLRIGGDLSRPYAYYIDWTIVVDSLISACKKWSPVIKDIPGVYTPASIIRTTSALQDDYSNFLSVRTAVCRLIIRYVICLIEDKELKVWQQEELF